MDLVEPSVRMFHLSWTKARRSDLEKDNQTLSLKSVWQAGIPDQEVVRVILENTRPPTSKHTVAFCACARVA